MGSIIINSKKFEEYAFEDEPEFEKCVIENVDFLFGKKAIYIDMKRRVGASSSSKGIPDGYVIDFSNMKSPQLYFIENELSNHNVYSHIAVQIARYSVIIATSQSQIRDLLIEEIKSKPELFSQITSLMEKGGYSSVEELMIYLTEKTHIKIVVVIDQVDEELKHVLDIFKNPPDALLLQRYLKDNEIVYYCEPLSEEVQESEISSEKEFDTVVCAAFEEGFREVFMEQNVWWAIRLSQKAREQLKYLAIYEKSPVGAINYVTEISDIKPYMDSGKWIVFLKNRQKIGPIEFDKPGSAPQSPRFTTYNKLITSSKLSELWDY